MAVPLAAGHHRLRLEYRPAAFTVGKWISLAACLLYVGAWLPGGARGERQTYARKIAP